jgi:transcriptional regulator with XRE-family HTH domain
MLTVPPDSIAGRLNLLVRSRGIRINELAGIIGLSGQGLRDILGGKSKNPKADVVVSLSNYLEVSCDYLLMGHESAFSGSGATAESKVAYLTRGRAPAVQQIIPYVPIRGLSTFVEGYEDMSRLDDVQRFSLPEGMSLKGEVIAFEVEGDSMFPDVKSGSLVVCTAETGDVRYLQSGSMYAVVYAGYFSIKRVINRVEADGVLELQPSNQAYTPIRVRVEDVKRLYRVQLVMQWV